MDKYAKETEKQLVFPIVLSRFATHLLSKSLVVKKSKVHRRLVNGGHGFAALNSSVGKVWQLHHTFGHDLDMCTLGLEAIGKGY